MTSSGCSIEGEPSYTTIKIKFAFCEGGGNNIGGREEIDQSHCFLGKRLDNKILKVQIRLSRNVVIIPQAPRHEAWRFRICAVSVFRVFPEMFLGRTPKGAYLPRGRFRHLLETPLLRTPFENPAQNPFLL